MTNEDFCDLVRPFLGGVCDELGFELQWRPTSAVRVMRGSRKAEFAAHSVWLHKGPAGIRRVLDYLNNENAPLNQLVDVEAVNGAQENGHWVRLPGAWSLLANPDGARSLLAAIGEAFDNT